MPVEKERQREKEPENAKMKDDFFSNIDQQSVQDVPEQPELMVVEKLHRKPSKSGKSDRQTEPELAVRVRTLFRQGKLPLFQRKRFRRLQMK